MVERIDWSQRELNIALRIDVIQNPQRHISEILHVDIFIHHYDAFREHRLPERPDGVHHFARLAGIGLPDRNNHQVVEDALNWQVDVNQFRDRELHHRQEDAFDRLAHVSVFLRRLADNGRSINGIFAMRDATQMKDRVEIFQRVEAGVIAEGPFAAEFVEVNVAFENDFAAGGNFEIHGFALDEIDRAAAQEAGNQVFLNLRRCGNDGGESDG